MFNLPQTTKAVIVQKGPNELSPDLQNGATVTTLPITNLKEGEVLVKIAAVAFNHRDVWIRKGLYPNIGIGSVFGADGAGTVIATSDPKDPLLNQRVFLLPQHGWRSAPEAPEGAFGVIGGVNWPAVGTFSEYVVISRDNVLLSPSHLDDTHVAAWPLAGVTAWRHVCCTSGCLSSESDLSCLYRATMVNGLVSSGQNVLITGIGGGVALTALQLCLAKGANVYVTSSSPGKIEKAANMGAKGGVNYKDSNWGKNLLSILKKTSDHGVLDVVIDSGGGDVFGALGAALKQGGRVVSFGMHATPEIKYTMRQVMRNQKLLGSTMGSYADLKEATEFIAAHKIVPIVSDVLEGLDKAEEGFKMLDKGGQFGKVVISVDRSTGGPRL
ncbi:hypothetical protein V5O48_006293 [Marasmius crinis-equi]|uniref:Enoyl reductase (ER) domain-containing protein n=1 Tax=Marasmius crinis-equi TaxID=585013 RepID=A0ABR3FJW5_9AGAR